MAVILPPVPTNLVAQQGNGQVFLTWNTIPGITNYTVQRSVDNITYSSIASPVIAEYLDTAVTQGVKYYYQVSSTNSQGDSSYCSPVYSVPAQPGLLSLGELRLMSQQRADRVGSDFVTTPEWNSYINQSYLELYDILIGAFEDYNVATPLIFTTDGSTTQYPLPDGILYSGAKPLYKLLGVDCGLASTSNAWVTLHKFDFISRNRYVFPNISSTYMGVFNLRYRIFGSTLFFIPTPSGAQYIRLWYIPRLATLLQDTDLADGISGWTEYVITDAAIKALQKEESDVSVLMAQKQMLLDRIQSMAQNRDAGMPDTISDTRSFSERWGGYGSPGGDGSFGGY